MAGKSGRIAYLDELQHKFVSGYIIIGQTLFEIDDSFVADSWDLDQGSLDEMVKQAREEADIDGRTLIVYDANEVYDADVVSEEGRLLTAFEAIENDDPEDRDGYESLAEYYHSH